MHLATLSSWKRPHNHLFQLAERIACIGSQSLYIQYRLFQPSTSLIASILFRRISFLRLFGLFAEICNKVRVLSLLGLAWSARKRRLLIGRTRSPAIKLVESAISVFNIERIQNIVPELSILSDTNSDITYLAPVLQLGATRQQHTLEACALHRVWA